jgi:hypothetical protein
MTEYTAKQAQDIIPWNYRTITLHGSRLGCGRMVGPTKVYTLSELKLIDKDIKGQGRPAGSKNKKGGFGAIKDKIKGN